MSERDGEPVVKKQRTSLHSAELRLDLEDDTTLLDLDEDLSWMTRCCEQLLASSSVSSSSTSSSSSSSSSSSLSIISGDESNDSVDLAVVATQASACEFDAFGFMASVPDRSHFRPQICEIERRGALLAHRDANDARPTLVLDLDETLVHSSVVPMEGADFVFPVEVEEGGAAGSFTVYAKKRPFCDQFLRAACARFEVVVFTASKRVYADRLLDLMGFRGGRLFREHCVFYQGAFLKDLEILGRNLARTVIVDNSPHVFSLQVRNGIPIESYFAAPHQCNDRELLSLLSMLEHLAGVEDVRVFLHRQFDLESRITQRVKSLI